MSLDENFGKSKENKHQYYKSVFEKYDKNKNGYIELKELREMVEKDNVPEKLLRKIFQRHDKNYDDQISFGEFFAMTDDENFKTVFTYYINIYKQYVLPRPQQQSLNEANPCCWPPPLSMVIISIIELACFLTDELTAKDSTKTGTGITANTFIYNPYRRKEFWRYFTYMFVHIGYVHLVVNLTVQLLLGVILELVNHSWRVLLIYLSGVIAGSLATSITDPSAFLAGASGGVYAIVTAHIGTIIMNWRETPFPKTQMVFFLTVTTADIGTSIYTRYWLNIHDNIGYAAHFAGALAGLLVGIWILRNEVPTKMETYIWWFAVFVYTSLMIVIVVLNIIWTDHFL